LKYTNESVSGRVKCKEPSKIVYFKIKEIEKETNQKINDGIFHKETDTLSLSLDLIHIE
jgi:hypothetical protein